MEPHARPLPAPLSSAFDRLRPAAEAILVRLPPIDPSHPATSDLDVLAFRDLDDYVPERVWPGEGEPSLDVTWLPQAMLDDPAALAGHGLFAHRFAGSQIVFGGSGAAARAQDEVRRQWAAARLRRVGGFLDLGAMAVREVGVTRDFHPLALFWLHMATAAAIAASVDAAGAQCPNVYTRALSYVEPGARDGRPPRDAVVRALRLETDPEVLVPALRRLHAVVYEAFPEPDWPAAVRTCTRAEYRYFRSPDELAWRVAVARELAARGDGPGAVWYLRFWGYVLARLPMVHAAAAAGRNVSFLRPERAVRPALAALCPDALGDLDAVLGGAAVTAETVSAAVAWLTDVRTGLLAALEARGAAPPAPAAWRPFDAVGV